MPITFDSIPSDLRTPGVFIEYNNTRAVRGSPKIPQKALIIGTRLAAGTVAVDIPVAVPSATLGETYFGHGSELAHMIDTFKASNPYIELWAIGIAESAGAVGTGTFTFAGTSTEAGSVYTYIGGERIVTAIPNATAAAAASVLHDADITAYLKKTNLPVSSGQATVVTTISSLHKGINANAIDLQLNYNEGEKLPAGLTCAVVQMGSGTQSGDITNAIAAMADVWYTTIVCSQNDTTNLGLLDTELLTRWGPTRMQDGMCFVSLDGSQGTLTSAGNAENSQFLCYMGIGLAPTPPWIMASVTAAVEATEQDPARPRQTMLLPGVLPPVPASQFTQTERGILLTDGISTYTVGLDGKCYIERLITTYQLTSSLPDPSYLDITTMRTLAYLRYTLRARIALRFPRHKLANDGTKFGAGQAVVTPAIIKSEIIALFKEWEADGLVEGVDQFITDIIVERNSSDVSRIDTRLSPDILNAFRVFAGQIQFLL